MPDLLSQEDRSEILKIYGEMKNGYTQLSALITQGQPTGEVKTKLDKIDESLMEFHRKHTQSIERLDSFEVKINEKARSLEPRKSIGRQVIEDPRLIEFVKTSRRDGYSMRIQGPLFQQKDILNLSPLQPQALAYIPTLPRMQFGVRQLVPQGRTSAGAVEYVRELTFTNNAAIVAEGAAKPKSDKTFEVVSAIVRTIAHYFKISRQTADDLPAIEAMIESNGVYGVQLEEDDQFINGSGVAPNLTGFMTVAVAAPATPAGGTAIDAIGGAIFDLAAKGYLADGVVMNPANWGAVAMLKNTQGNYLFANPMDYSAAARIWGVRLAFSGNLAAGSYLVGAFSGNSLILDREDVNVQVATQNEDDFIKNMLTILIEERTVLLIFRAAAFEKGTVPAPALAGAFGGPSGPTATPPETEEGRGRR